METQAGRPSSQTGLDNRESSSLESMPRFEGVGRPKPLISCGNPTPAGPTISVCTLPPANPTRGFRFEVSPLTSTTPFFFGMVDASGSISRRDRRAIPIHHWTVPGRRGLNASRLECGVEARGEIDDDIEPVGGDGRRGAIDAGVRGRAASRRGDRRCRLYRTVGGAPSGRGGRGCRGAGGGTAGLRRFGPQSWPGDPRDRRARTRRSGAPAGPRTGRADERLDRRLRRTGVRTDPRTRNRLRRPPGRFG